MGLPEKPVAYRHFNFLKNYEHPILRFNDPDSSKPFLNDESENFNLEGALRQSSRAQVDGIFMGNTPHAGAFYTII